MDILVSLLSSLDLKEISEYLSSAAQHQFVQFTFAFTLAAFIHSGRVKKEIRDQFESLVSGLDRLGEKLENRIEKVEDGVNKLHSRVEALEKK